MKRRDVYLRIEKVAAYSPVAPDEAEHDRYRHDCMHGDGHHDGHIPPAEEARRTLDAVTYREYLDAGYTVPQTAPLVATDVTEPRWDRRIPGAVLYAEPGERLAVHVRNDDDHPHSFHVHGLVYGIDSDGAWPFGVHSHSGTGGYDERRSDAICPGQQWCYLFDITEETIGAWPFHDHHMHIAEAVDRGLFGGIVVRDPAWEHCDVEIPFFLHRLTGAPGGDVLFDSGSMAGGDVFAHTFPVEGTFDYVCRFHPMQGTVRVTAGGTPGAAVSIQDSPTARFDPPEVTIAPGAVVTWTHTGTMPHTVSDTGGAGLDSFAINGRTFVGNTPTIVARTGQRLRWYVFDLDLGERWHNFHPHGQRFRVGNEWMDTRSLGPAESFVVETRVPPVVLPPDDEGHGSSRKRTKRTLRGDFLVHCHVEMHMMQGMAAVVRAIQDVQLTDEQAQAYGFHLPVDEGGHCPHVEHPPCHRPGVGRWEQLPAAPIFIVHAAVLHTGRVLLWSGTAEVGDPLESRCWNPADGTMTTQTYGEDLFCSGHAFLPDGRLCVAGGAPSGVLRSTHIFDPGPETWTKVADMSQARWYPTVLTLPDGRILAASGTGATEVEIYDAGADAWTVVAGASRVFQELYPSLHLLPTGGVFYSRAGWRDSDLTQPGTALLSLSGPATGTWSPLGQQQFPDRQEGTSVITVDATVDPPVTRIMVIGGGVAGPPTSRSPQSAEVVDLTQPAAPPAAWSRTADMAFARTNVNAVLLPDGTVLVVGGQRAGKWNPDPQPVLEAEIYDPATGTWSTTAAMASPRQYHSVAVLLPDGRVLSAGGVDPSPGAPNRDQRTMELFLPAYLDRGPRPVITVAPASVAYGSPFDIDTPDAAAVGSVVLLRPNSVTHHTDAGQRLVRIPIQSRTATRIEAVAPAHGAVAPPGFYLLFVLTGDGVPSEGRFVRLQ